MIGWRLADNRKYRKEVNRKEEIKNYLLLSKFLQIQNQQYMSLLRKNTMPEWDSSSLNKKPQTRSKACSQINLFQFGRHFANSSGFSKNRKRLDLSSVHNSGFLPQETALGKDEIDKIVVKNSLTVNFSESSEVNALPSITTFDKMKGILIKKPIFQRFKECNKENGSYNQELEQLSREDELQKAKQSIKTQPKLASRNQLYKKDRKSLSSISIVSSCLSIKSRHLQRVSDNFSNDGFRLNNLSFAKYYPKECVIQLPNENAQIVFENKLRVAEKLEQITQACLQTQEDYKIQKSINLFAKFSEKMDYGLLRKKKKLEKVHHFRL